MARIGLSIEIGNDFRGHVADVKRQVLEKLQVDQRHPIDVYRMVPLVDNDTVNVNDSFVVSVPGSKLDCAQVDDLVHTCKLQEDTIVALKIEIAQLQSKLTHSNSVRQDALGTVNQLRAEFIHLIEELTPRTSQAATTREKVLPNSRKLPEFVTGSSTHRRVPVTQRSVPRLGIGKLRT